MKIITLLCELLCFVCYVRMEIRGNRDRWSRSIRLIRQFFSFSFVLFFVVVFFIMLLYDQMPHVSAAVNVYIRDRSFCCCCVSCIFIFFSSRCLRRVFAINSQMRVRYLWIIQQYNSCWTHRETDRLICTYIEYSAQCTYTDTAVLAAYLQVFRVSWACKPRLTYIHRHTTPNNSMYTDIRYHV